MRIYKIGIRGKTKYPPADGHFTSIKRPSSLLTAQEVKLHQPIKARKFSRMIEERKSVQNKYLESLEKRRIMHRDGMLECWRTAYGIGFKFNSIGGLNC